MPARIRALRCCLMTAALLLILLGVGVPVRSQEAPAAAGPPYRVGGDVTRPELISNVRPVYTELARRARVTGIVILEATIDEQGTVADVRVLKGLPMGLDRSAVEAVQQWKFKPATLKGQPVAVYYVLTVNFQIDDSPRYGPFFTKVLAQHADFAKLLYARSFPEAAELLERWAAEEPGSSEVSLARCYLLLEQGRLKEAWQQALEYRGPEPFEVHYQAGVFAFKAVAAGKSLDPAAQAEIIELGLQAETMAMAENADSIGAIMAKTDLLRRKVSLTNDPKERQALIDEIDGLSSLARERYESQGGASRPDGG